MLGTCPACGGRRLRYSHRRNAVEVLRGWLGSIPVRCRDCRHRFVVTLWNASEWGFARCPRCYRTDLNYWSETHYHVSFWQRLKIGMGAKKYRCEVCRCNFTSFGRLKERYRFRKRSSSAADPKTAVG